jgi:hypothetical protein
MNTVLIWIFIAIIGLLLYLAPSYLSEGFDPSPLGAINPNIDPSNYKDITAPNYLNQFQFHPQNLFLQQLHCQARQWK